MLPNLPEKLEIESVGTFLIFLAVYYYYLKATCKTEKEIYKNLLYYCLIFGLLLIIMVIPSLPYMFR